MFIDMPPLSIEDAPLPYVAQLSERPLGAIRGIVIHCTESPDLASARDLGERVHYQSTGTGNSGHFYIDRDGRVLRYVEATRVAHHVRGFNDQTVGIELVNTGRHPRWFDRDHQSMTEPYPVAQIAALIALLRLLSNTLPNVEWVAGHEDLDQDRIPATDDPMVLIARKRDPGPLFPWAEVLQATPLPRRPHVAPLTEP